MAEMSMVDDLADVLARMCVGWKAQTGIDLAEHPDVVRVMQRYREYKTPCTAHIWHGPGHQSKTMCEVKGKHTDHEADIMGMEVYWDSEVASYDGQRVYERVYCDEGDNCHCLREPGATYPCGGWMHPRNRTT